MLSRYISVGVIAVVLACSAQAVGAASLGLTVTGNVDSGSGELTAFIPGEFAGFATLGSAGDSNLFFATSAGAFNTFDSGNDIASILDYGFSGTTLEFQLDAFDSYTNGALLSITLMDGMIYSSDPLTAISGLSQAYFAAANFSVQALGNTVVPVPAGFLLLGTALVGLGLVRRKKER